MPHTFLIDDAARLLGVSRRTVYYRIRDGHLVTIRTKCGSQRVLLSSIQRLLREMQGLPAGNVVPSEPAAASDPCSDNPAMGTGC